MTRQVKIQHFTDYRTFLVAYAQEAKTSKSKWTYGTWAKSLGLKSTSSITKILHGKRDPGPDAIRRLSRYFRFSAEDAEYFRDLVALHKIRHDPHLSVLLLEKMNRKLPNGAVRLLDDKTFSVISRWFYLPLRELSRLPGFVEDPELIARGFRFKVTPREIREALEALQAVGLLRRGPQGRLEVVEGRINTSDDVASEAIKRYHEQMLGHASASVRSVPVDARELTAASLAMRSSDLPRAKEMIREFRKKFAQTFEDVQCGDAVFQIQLQLFPLTQTPTRKETDL